MLQYWNIWASVDLEAEERWSKNFEELPSSLYFLAQWGFPHLSSLVLKYKLAEVNATGGEKGTALIVACYEGHESVVRLLLDAGADLVLGNDMFCCPLQVAILTQREACAKMLLEKDNTLAMYEEKIGYQPLLDAAAGGFVAIVELLLQLGADADAKYRGEIGTTALKIAAKGL